MYGWAKAVVVVEFEEVLAVLFAAQSARHLGEAEQKVF